MSEPTATHTEAERAAAQKHFASGRFIAHSPECAAQHFAPWMVEERWFRGAVQAVKSGSLQPKVVASGDGPGSSDGYTVHSGIAVIPIAGAIMKKASKYGGTSSVSTRKAIRSAVNDESVHSILLHIDSPGGTVAGTGDLASDVRAADAVKPTYAHIDDLGASAAYWVASQARRITANPTAEIGSIGTLLVLEDTSGAYAADGIKVHVISTGKYKGAGADGAPITDEQIAMFQQEVDDLNAHFLAGVAKGRKMPMDQVRGIADGRVHIAAKAVGLGLIDQVGSLDSAVSAILKDNRQRVAAAIKESPEPSSERVSMAAITAATPNQITQPAPEASRESDPPSAVSQEHLMPDPILAPTAAPAQTPAAPAPAIPSQGHPAAPAAPAPVLIPMAAGAFSTVHEAIDNFRAVQAPLYHQQGYEQGLKDGANRELDRAKAIAAVCPGKEKMALDSFFAGQSPEAVKLAYESTARAEAIAEEAAKKKDMEIVRLNTLLALGGHPGVAMGIPESESGGEENIPDPKAHAEREWDFKTSVRKGFVDKASYVGWRVRELNGTVSVGRSSAE